MTRTTDTTVSLSQRCKIANDWGADFFVSIHINAGGGTGYEDYVWTQAVAASSGRFQDVVHGEVVKVLNKWGIRNRGKKRANFQVLRNTKMKALLFEILFIDNAADAKLLKDSAFRQEIADAIADGIAKAEGLKKKARPTPKFDDSKTGPKPYIRVAINGEQKHAFEKTESVVNWIRKKVKAGDTVDIRR